MLFIVLLVLPSTLVSTQKPPASKDSGTRASVVQPKDSFAKIDDSYQLGEISYDERARLMATAMYNKDGLPAKYSGDVIAEDITTIILDLKHNWDKLSPETQALFQGRAGFTDASAPDWTSSSADCATGAGMITLASYVDTSHFRIHYTTSGGNAATLAYANTIGSNAEVGYQVRGNMNFKNARLDGVGGGGSNKIDIYIADLVGFGFYGVTFAEILDASSSNPNDYVGYICVDKNLPTNRLQSTPVHEYHHLVQFAYNAWEFGWLMEATATWFQKKVWPSNDQYYSRITTLMSTADYDLTSTYSDRAYGAAGFLLYFDTQLGNDIVRRIWDKTVTSTFASHPDFKAVTDALKVAMYGYDWKTAIFDFWAAMQMNSGYSSLARGYHLQAVDQSSWAWPEYQSFGGYSGTTKSLSDNDGTLRWGGCDSLAVAPSVNSMKITFDGADAGNFLVAVVRVGLGGTAQQSDVIRLGLGAGNVGDWSTSSALNFVEYDIYIININYDTGTTSYGWTVTLSPP